MLLANNKKTLATLIILSFLVSGCVVYPRKKEYFDPECQIKTKKMEMAIYVSRGDWDGGCGDSNDAAAACLGIILGVAAASAIISGSVYVVGNTIYWLEREGKCWNKPVVQAANAPSR